MSKPALKLDWCSYQTARYACEKWHYSRLMPRSRAVKIGVWEDGAFIGCLIYADGANNNMLRPYGLNSHQGCELVRIALRSHRTPVTRLVALSLKLLRRHAPSLRLVVSYADPAHGHHGGIYQGGNWIYSGMTGPRDEYVVRHRRMHGRALRQTRSSHRLRDLPAANVLEWARKVIDPDARKVCGSRKHRYLMPLDDEMRCRLEPLRRPYPKNPRATGVDSDTPGDRPGEGGASPTVALPDECMHHEW